MSTSEASCAATPNPKNPALQGATADVYLHGAHVTSFKPSGGQVRCSAHILSCLVLPMVAPIVLPPAAGVCTHSVSLACSPHFLAKQLINLLAKFLQEVCARFELS